MARRVLLLGGAALLLGHRLGPLLSRVVEGVPRPEEVELLLRLLKNGGLGPLVLGAVGLLRLVVSARQDVGSPLDGPLGNNLAVHERLLFCELLLLDDGACCCRLLLLLLLLFLGVQLRHVLLELSVQRCLVLLLLLLHLRLLLFRVPLVVVVSLLLLRLGEADWTVLLGLLRRQDLLLAARSRYDAFDALTVLGL